MYIGLCNMHAGVRPAAAVAASSPFDIGTAWHRLSAASILSPASWTQLVIVLRHVPWSGCVRIAKRCCLSEGYILGRRWQHYAWKHRAQLSRLKGYCADAIQRSRTMMDIDKELTCKAREACCRTVY